jgi:glycosyltransferase involved in cell wall biosynthesis
VADRFQDRRLVIAGDGDPSYVRELRGLAGEGPGAGRIEFAGWVGGADRARLFASASAFVLPSAQENFGLSMVEAMAAATPVVVARTVDLAATIAGERAGWVVNRSAEAVASALIECLSDPLECRLRGARARRVAERYRWGRVATELKVLYAEMAVPVVR